MPGKHPTVTIKHRNGCTYNDELKEGITVLSDLDHSDILLPCTVTSRIEVEFIRENGRVSIRQGRSAVPLLLRIHSEPVPLRDGDELVLGDFWMILGMK